MGYIREGGGKEEAIGGGRLEGRKEVVKQGGRRGETREGGGRRGKRRRVGGEYTAVRTTMDKHQGRIFFFHDFGPHQQSKRGS
jgi:hypothetical protein